MALTGSILLIKRTGNSKANMQMITVPMFTANTIHKLISIGTKAK